MDKNWKFNAFKKIFKEEINKGINFERKGYEVANNELTNKIKISKEKNENIISEKSKESIYTKACTVLENGKKISGITSDGNLIITDNIWED